ncbi:hypothetical protein DEU56DRAFT_820905 [Suillus clintonianus]|uniref:uncharacterized protein n=1 Tax=Suillus clintonianus TaxID=1904413 RepID=UPI001B8656BE|nr:uncharacterized protein DEU56DRAFT_820905 [Suillus clintonianus]KAG2127234.1 hypothetical protein DEU56DRAFT_820905 [Suillus clintonianus]
MRMVLAWMSSCLPPSPTTTHSPAPSPYHSSSALLSRPTPPSRPTSPVLQALNCFSTSSAFNSDVDDSMPMNRREIPVLQVIVTQTRERYEDDMAFKEIVGSIYPGPVAGAVLRSSGA